MLRSFLILSNTKVERWLCLEKSLCIRQTGNHRQISFTNPCELKAPIYARYRPGRLTGDFNGGVVGNDKFAESALQFNLATKTDIAAKSKVGRVMQSNDVIWNRSGHRQSGDAASWRASSAPCSRGP